MKYLKQYRFYGIISHMGEINADKNFIHAVQTFMQWERDERICRQLNSAIRATRLYKYESFTPINEFDWTWPKKIDKETVVELCDLKFIREQVNVILLGPSGTGKTTIAKNLVELSAKSGFHSVFIEASEMLDDILIDTSSSKSIRIKLEKYAKPDLLAIDEMGYLSYNTQHADILFQLINKRYKKKSTIITTNRSFGEWPQLFPNAASVNALVDRLIERCEVIQIDADTYRGKLFTERKKEKENKLKNKK